VQRPDQHRAIPGTHRNSRRICEFWANRKILSASVVYNHVGVFAFL
jgi:hypothetical protein